MISDNLYMERAICLAQNGLGTTYPNPMVGAVIVAQGTIIGEGWHRRSGCPHAEPLAIDSVTDKELLGRSTLYVTLEPCSHFGKTPPCADRIISAGIPRVVIGTKDPFSKVNGEGIRKLQEAGCEVTVGVMEEECRWVNRRFFTFHRKKRPYVILKFARSRDGFLDGLRELPPHINQGYSNAISNVYSRQISHRFRTEEQAILVGTRTALMDNPSLSARLWDGSHPLRIALDRTGRIPSEAHLKDGSQPTLIFTEKKSENRPNLEYCRIPFDQEMLPNIMDRLYERGIQSLIVEGGKALLESFIREGLWDEARVFTGAVSLEEGIEAPRIEGRLEETMEIKDDVLEIFSNR